MAVVGSDNDERLLADAQLPQTSSAWSPPSSATRGKVTDLLQMRESRLDRVVELEEVAECALSEMWQFLVSTGSDGPKDAHGTSQASP